MKPKDTSILTVNAGSSSLKFALFRASPVLSRQLLGKFERLGLPEAGLTVTNLLTNQTDESVLPMSDHAGGVPLLVERLERSINLDVVSAIGHRVVHGGPQDP